VHNGLLLNGVDVPGHDAAVDKQVELASNDSSDPTEPDLSLGDLAISGAGCALDPAVGEVPVKFSLLPCRLGEPRPERHPVG